MNAPTDTLRMVDDKELDALVVHLERAVRELAMLAERPGIRYAMLVDNLDTPSAKNGRGGIWF